MSVHGIQRNDLLETPLASLMARAREVRGASGLRLLTYSRKVFVPLTQLCRDACGYCTFAKTPRGLPSPYMSIDEVLAIAKAGAEAGCKEVLFTLGDKPELRYASARSWLTGEGFATTVEYLEHAARAVHREFGLAPHINAGVLSAEDYARLRPVAASMGLMLESTSEALCARGGPHDGAPDKQPSVRLASIAEAGKARIPFTSGILIGIGETRQDRLDALFALRALHEEYGHLQEIIVQNFKAKAGTRMAAAPEPAAAEVLWTIACARLILPPAVAVQSPPNLNTGRTRALIDAGVNDWGGISPVTIDHVNPEAPWPEVAALEAECADAGWPLAERLTVYPRFLEASDTWIDVSLRPTLLRLSDGGGLARDCHWSPGAVLAPPSAPARRAVTAADARLERTIGRAIAGRTLTRREIVSLFSARGPDAELIANAANALRHSKVGDDVTYVINRNINYTNICKFHCTFCAFSKTSSKGGLRDRPYDLELEEIGARAREAWDKGATEVCLQGGIHPSYTGDTYIGILRAVKHAAPEIHVHAFSPLEVSHGAATLNVPIRDFLARLKDEGLGSLPGTAAEILDDAVRAHICPDKLSTGQWLGVVGAAHAIGLPTTSTIMFGHMESYHHWANHLLALRKLQYVHGGITEFVPLPFVHMQAPIYLRGQARKGPTWREVVLMHAVSRLTLNGAIDSIQVSWVKLGPAGAAACLTAGANDLGGTLMNESISRAAGAAHGQQLTIQNLETVAAAAGRRLKRRTTLYAEPPPRRTMRSNIPA